MSDLLNRLNKMALGSADEDVMVKWDKIRSILKQDKGGTWPRECFEGIIDSYAETCEEAVDKIEGLEADLDSAVEVAWKRGATDWVRMNYPKHYERFTTGEDASPRTET